MTITVVEDRGGKLFLDTSGDLAIMRGKADDLGSLGSDVDLFVVLHRTDARAY